MKIQKLDSLWRRLMSGSVVVLASLSMASAQNFLNISQPVFDTGLPVSSWAWQSFSVAEACTLSSFGFEWNGGSGDLTVTATVDLLTGEGTAGDTLASATGSITYDDSGPYAGSHFFAADFGNIDLAPGEYTAYVHNPTAGLNFVGTDYDSYSGGKFVSSDYGDLGMDATFFTPSPSSVPEPSAISLVIIGLAYVGGYNFIRRRGRKV